MTEKKQSPPVKYKCAGPRVLDEEGRPGRQRIYCGADLTKLILALPEDGEEHEVQCPKCETVGVHRRVP